MLCDKKKSVLSNIGKRSARMAQFFMGVTPGGTFYVLKKRRAEYSSKEDGWEGTGRRNRLSDPRGKVRLLFSLRGNEH